MKTSRTNSFRLHRIGKTNSVKKSAQTFYEADESFKLAALNSVTRGVKHADISFLTGQDLNKLRVEPLEANEGLYTSAHDNLTEVRKRYDEIKKQRVRLQEKIDKQKEQINKFSIFQGEYEGKITQAKQKANALKKNLDDIKNILEITIIEKKVLLEMEGRHKTDKVYYDQKKFNLEKQLEFLRKQKAIFKKEGHEIGESEDRTTKIYQKLSNQLERQKFERDQHIRSLQTMIEEKIVLLNSNQSREADLYEIAERAIQDKDLNEKQWRKIFLTHTFVNKMLRNKIQKEMDKFKIVELAFKEIKTATGVTDAKTLVTKYLNKQAVYGQLLGKIAQNEKTIQSLKNETQELIHEQKALEIEREVLHSVKIKSQDLHNEIKELQQFDQKSVISETQQKKIGQWLVRQLKKLSTIHRKQDDLEIPKTKEKIKQIFAKYLNIIQNQVQTGSSGSQFIEVNGNESFTNKQTEKIVRIIPRRARRNSQGEDIFDVDEQETPPSVNVEEQEIISNQREQLLKTNEKFMRDLKRKKDQERKIFLGKNQSKNEKPVAKAQSPQKQE